MTHTSESIASEVYISLDNQVRVKKKSLVPELNTEVARMTLNIDASICIGCC